MKPEFNAIILIITLLTCLIPHSSAVITVDADWTQKEEITLEWGDSYSTGNYTIVVEDFNRQAVQIALGIYKHDEKIQTAIMSAGETTEVSTIKITINSIRGCSGETESPFAKMTIYTMKPPAISLDTKGNMTSQGLTNISVILENSGGIRFYNITLDVLLPEDLMPYKDHSNNYQTNFDSVQVGPNSSMVTSTLENISVNSKVTRWINVEMPALPQKIDVPVSVHAHGIDLDMQEYNVSKEVNISIEPAIKVVKMPLHKMVNTSEDYFNMNDRVYVSISVYNLATTDAFNVNINETLHTSNFIMDPESELEWTFDLPPRQSFSCSYYLKPIRPGEFQISTTSISREYKEHTYINTINSTTASIYGPYFEINKTLNNYKITPDETVNVTVVAKNTGNHASYLSLEDEIPAFAQLIDGHLNVSGVVKPGNTLSTNYTLKMEKTGSFRFSPAVGQYNARHYSGIAYSTRPLINIEENTPTPTMTEPEHIMNNSSGTNNSEKSDSKGIPGFYFLNGLLVFILLYVSNKKST
jgi:hypothetical protein